MIDVNASLGRWPFRRLPLDDPAALAGRLRGLGVERAWVGHLDALLHKDIAAVNARLAGMCERHGDGLFLPFGAVNPTLPDWPEDLRRCHESHRMPGIRLHPDFHGYGLDDPVVPELLAAASDRGLIVQVELRMEDARMRHPRLAVAEVDPAPLVGHAEAIRGLRLIVLNAGGLLGAGAAGALGGSRVAVEIATMEGVGGLGRLIESIGADRILFGTHAPMFIPEAAVLKLEESAPAPDEREAVVRGNALRMLGAG